MTCQAHIHQSHFLISSSMRIAVFNFIVLLLIGCFGYGESVCKINEVHFMNKCFCEPGWESSSPHILNCTVPVIDINGCYCEPHDVERTFLKNESWLYHGLTVSTRLMRPQVTMTDFLFLTHRAITAARVCASGTARWGHPDRTSRSGAATRRTGSWVSGADRATSLSGSHMHLFTLLRFLSQGLAECREARQPPDQATGGVRRGLPDISLPEQHRPGLGGRVRRGRLHAAQEHHGGVWSILQGHVVT